MRPGCPRSFEAEALRDGRLVGAELASFERHLATCPRCAHEMAALNALGDALRRATPEDGDADELHARRERTRLLAAFDAALLPPERASGSRRWLLGVAAAGALGLCLFFVARGRHPEQDASGGAPIVVHADSTARWSRLSEGSLEKIRLEQGALSIRVEHGHDDRQRLLVVLPDGELEDIGTTFTVSADAGRTTRVTVQEGSVVLRIQGQPALAMGKGDAWSPAAKAPASACASCEAASAPTASAAASTSVAAVNPAPARAPVRGVSGPSARAPASEGSAAPRLDEASPSREFRAAMSALDAGDNATAAARFTRFLGEHPGDARAEDAAYLRVIALQRSGNASGTREAARQYLRSYPKGFRRAEIEAIAP